VLLTQAQVDYQARKANWYVSVDFNDINVPGDPYIVTGDGVDDLDRLISLMPIYPRGKYFIDVGTVVEQFVPCDVADIQAIRTAYIAYYGNVNKPGPPIEYPEADEVPLADVAVPPPSPVLT
jgi:hypothetical protein